MVTNCKTHVYIDKTEIMSCLLRLECQKKDFWKSIPTFFLIQLELKWRYWVPLKTIPKSRPKWAKTIPVFRPKRGKNHTLRGSTYLYGLYKEEVPPRGLRTLKRVLFIFATFIIIINALHLLYYYMKNFCNLIGLEQCYFSLIWNTYMGKLQTFCG